MKDGGVIHELRLFDVSKPAQLRTAGAFVTYLGEEARKRLPAGDITDEKITIVVREIGVVNATIKLKGEVFLGIIPAVELVKTVEGEIPVRPDKSPATEKAGK